MNTPTTPMPMESDATYAEIKRVSDYWAQALLTFLKMTSPAPDESRYPKIRSKYGVYGA